MKLIIANWFVSLMDLGPEIGCIIGPVMISGLMTTRSKVGESVFMNVHAADSALVFETLYPRTVSFLAMASSAVTCTSVSG